MSISKILTDLYVIKQKIIINIFANIAYNVLVVKMSCKINGKQSIKLKSCSNKFRNHFKQLAVPFKIIGDFESFLKRL